VNASQEFELSIHRRLLAGDSVASEELVTAYLSRLVKTLRKRLWQRDDAVLVNAAIDALFSYIQRPNLFDPEKSSLFSYLAMAARGDLLNAVDKEVTRRKHEIAVNSVEDERDRRNIVLDRVDPGAPDERRRVEIMYGRELAKKLRKEIVDPRDWKLLELMYDGVRDTRSYAVLLDADGLSEKEQQRLVKQHKDRLNKQLERFRARLHGKGKR
jgi:RNA polymerase sigma-70 factor, ECF subfamily